MDTGDRTGTRRNGRPRSQERREPFSCGTLALIMLMPLITLPMVAAHGQVSPPSQTSRPVPPVTDKKPPAATDEGTPAKVIDNQQLEGLLGRRVRSSAGEHMGQIVDLLVDRTGQVRAVVIDFGGFLGVGSRKIVVDWSALQFAPAGKSPRITLEFTRDQLRLAPEYKRGEPVVVLKPPSTAPPASGKTPVKREK